MLLVKTKIIAFKRLQFFEFYTKNAKNLFKHKFYFKSLKEN